MAANAAAADASAAELWQRRAWRSAAREPTPPLARAPPADHYRPAMRMGGPALAMARRRCVTAPRSRLGVWEGGGGGDGGGGGGGGGWRARYVRRHLEEAELVRRARCSRARGVAPPSPGPRARSYARRSNDRFEGAGFSGGSSSSGSGRGGGAGTVAALWYTAASVPARGLVVYGPEQPAMPMRPRDIDTAAATNTTTTT